VQHAAGDHSAVGPNLTEALAIFRNNGEPVSQASVLVAQANHWRITGDHTAAEQALAQALAISRDCRAEGVETEMLNTTGSLRYASGDLDDAADHHRKALHRGRQLALPLEEGRALAGLGRCALSIGDHSAALALMQQAHAALIPTGGSRSK
jgi:tetratricopeptide (TPR) repeat protein